jgi:peptide/nickel transport system substrate-binding protein
MSLPSVRRHRLIVLFAAGAVITAVAAGGAVGRPTKSSPPKIDRNATLTWASVATTLTLDPQALTSAPQLMPQLWDRLTTFDGHGNLKPMIALSWKAAKDAKSITFKLRKGVKFHDGTPLDATAVKESLDRARTTPRPTAALLTDIDSVDVVDPYTVRVNLKFGGAELPTLFAGASGAIINPKCIEANTDLSQMPDQCTSGAWTLVAATPPSDYRFTRWKGKYWDPNAWRFANLHYVQIGNATAIFNALQAGDIDIGQITTDGIAQFRSLKASGQLKGKIFIGPAMSAFVFNPRIPPFNNELLRKAVQAAIDPKPIASQFFAGNCPPTQQPAVGPAKDPKWSPDPYNVDKAKQYLAQAGVPNGFSFVDTVPNVTSTTGPAQIIQDQLSKVGIKMDQQVVPGSSDVRLVTGVAQASMSSLGAAIDPSAAATQLFNLTDGRLASAVGTSVEQQLQTLRFHALDPTLSPAKRGKVYQEMWKIAYDHALFVGICQNGLTWAYRSNVLNADYIPYVLPYSAGSDLRYIALASS